MRPNTKQAITLIELIISIVLLAMVVVGFYSIDIFSRTHLVASDHRIKLQNDAAYVVEHIAKKLANAIGDSESLPIDLTPAPNANWRTTEAIVGHIDNGDGIRNDTQDWPVRYCYNGNTACGGNPSEVNSVFFQNNTDAYERLSRKISSFQIQYDSLNSRNTMNVSVTACWEPSVTSGPKACGSRDNPQVIITSSMRFPSVSIK